MSVSADNGVAGGGATSDLNAVLGTNKEFAQRLADLKTSRESLEKASADLALGKNAVDALDEAKAVKIAAERERGAAYEALQTEMQRIRDNVAAQVAAAQADIRDKQRASDANLNAAKDKHDQAQAALDAARTTLAAAEARVAQLELSAKTWADALVADASAKAATMTDQAEKALIKIGLDQQAAAKAKAEFEDKLAKLKDVLG